MNEKDEGQVYEVVVGNIDGGRQINYLTSAIDRAIDHFNSHASKMQTYGQFGSPDPKQEAFVINTLNISHRILSLRRSDDLNSQSILAKIVPVGAYEQRLAKLLEEQPGNCHFAVRALVDVPHGEAMLNSDGALFVKDYRIKEILTIDLVGIGQGNGRPNPNSFVQGTLEDFKKKEGQ